MVEEDSLRGVTSNPAIFEKAILGSPDYDEQLERARRGRRERAAIYRAMAVRDIQDGLRRPAARVGRRRTATTATSRSRSTPTWPSTPT